MNIITLIRIEDGRQFQGFLDWDAMSRQMNFYYYDEDRNGWVSDKLGKFKPVPNPPSAISEALQATAETGVVYSETGVL